MHKAAGTARIMICGIAGVGEGNVVADERSKTKLAREKKHKACISFVISCGPLKGDT